MKIGFTSSLPVEVIFAAGHTPVDLNNIFINNNPTELVEQAEFSGYPRNICSWIKGIYSAVLQYDIDAMIGVMEGDCSNTHSLMWTLQDRGVKVIPFAFPYDKDKTKLNREISKLEDYFGVERTQSESVKQELDRIRKKLIYLDELTYRENKVSGWENHYWLVNSSDFRGNPDEFESELDTFLSAAQARSSFSFKHRLAYLGVPPIIPDLYDYLQSLGCNVIYNEIQRQFSMPYLCDDLVEQYLKYTYPYSIFDRLADIKQETKKRNVDACISYAQAFCHRQIDTMLIKKHLEIPVLMLEGDTPQPLDNRTKIRLESFVDMLDNR